MKKLLLLGLLLLNGCIASLQDIEVAISTCKEANSTLDRISVGPVAHTAYCKNGMNFTIVEGKVNK